ncbi:MAG: hypothetical protein M1831_003612 [Alyxoria varia]|nr:MAG: hypothetical protein M1831_003612 [Alyxoria varia]
MLPYFFHLAFELRHSNRASPDPAKDQVSSIFTPGSNFDLFEGDLPTHELCSWASYICSRSPNRHSKSNTSIPQQRRLEGFAPNIRTKGHSQESPLLPRRQASKEPPKCKQALEGEDTCSDWRYDKLAVQSIDMAPTGESVSGTHANASREHHAAQLSQTGLTVKGRFVPTNPKTTELGTGVVHLYRDPLPSSTDPHDPQTSHKSQIASNPEVDERKAYVDQDSTTLCILAVPSYMTPADLLGWIGEDAREDISHFRLIKTERTNKYMVLMKFRETSRTKLWQSNWNGKLFNTMEPENCHVVFIRSIQFQTFDNGRDPSSYPEVTNNPFTPIVKEPSDARDASRSSTTLTAKPAPPPTPALVELPTCPVCLERMDETTGLATIFCQHVFHCACLQKWKGSGCPVCRYTQDDMISKAKKDSAEDAENECRVCGSTTNLWICLICGHVGCGRYDEAHARAHFENTSHSFAMDISTQHIWDYVGDEYVHRLIQNQSDGKLVELPPSAPSERAESGELIPRQKMENMSLEYTYLLTSQLDSQRNYFEEQVERAVDKASKATVAAEQAAENAVKAASRLEALESTNASMAKETLPSLERDKGRAEKKADKFESMARKMEKEWREKEVINESLMDRISHLEKQVDDLTFKNSDLEEQNRDLSFFISGTEKLKDHGDEVQHGTLSVADPPPQNTDTRKKKGKGKN